MDELLAALKAAFDDAGLALPDDPTSLAVGDLDNLITDKRLRGKAKSALTKLLRAAGVDTHAARSAAPAEPAPAPEPEPAPEPVAEAVEPTPEPEPEEEEEEPEVAAPPMSDDLAVKFASVEAAFAAAGAEVPADPLGLDLETLDDAIADKKLRATCKSALVKFRRAAEAEGWSAAPPKRKQAARAATVTPTAAAASGEPRAPRADGVPEPAAGSPGELWLLRGSEWVKLGTATRQPSHVDELVGRKTDAGTTQRINSILILDGLFEVPADIYNNLIYLAHEGVVYKAYYISHLGDVKRGSRTASLKVHATYTYAEFVAEFVRLGKSDRPNADRLRLSRFGRRYDLPEEIFAVTSERLI